MLKEIKLKDLTLENGTIKEQSTIINFSEKSGSLLANGEKGVFWGEELENYKYLVIEAKSYTNNLTTILLQFWEEGNETSSSNIQVYCSILPGIKVIISFELSNLNSQKIFLPRTPGKTKTVVHGKKVDIQKLNKFSIGTTKCFETQAVEFFDIYLTDEEPEYSLENIKLVDEFGQWINKEWEGKIKDEAELINRLKTECDQVEALTTPSEEFGNFGGWKKKKFNSTGFFRTEYDGKRWWLVDPEGFAFITTGTDVTAPGESGRIEGIHKLYKWLPEKESKYKVAYEEGERFIEGDYYNFGVSNLIRAFGSSWWDSWAKITRNRLINWGFNSIGNWSDLRFIKYANMPYVLPLEGFPSTESKVFRDFPDVFSPEYELNSQSFAESITPFKEEKNLIGYFLRNEPEWAFVVNLNIAEELLENENKLASKEKLIKVLSEKYENSISKFNNSWNLQLTSFEDLNNKIVKAASLSEAAKVDLKAFSEIMIRRYVEVPSKAIKNIDPHHLNLGMRYAYIWDKVLLAGSENFDVFSLNCYQISALENIEEVGKLTGLPVMIGEFHFGSLDAGPIGSGIFAVGSQKDRGLGYKYYMENSVRSKYFVGAHYFILNDQAVLGRFDGENHQIGCVDVCHTPYNTFLKYISETNRNIYKVAEGIAEECKTPPKVVERVGF